MKHIKSERLKKLESEYIDLQQWLKMGLVPKRDITKHTEEIQQIKEKIDEEKERLNFLKESGDIEEYIAPKKSQGRTLSDMPTMPDIDNADTMHGSESSFENENTNHGQENTLTDKDEETEVAETKIDEDADEESYFSDRNRWRRGGIVDPDADDW